MTFCPAPRKWFKGHAPAWLFFFFAQLFLFLNPDPLPDWRSLKNENFLARVYVRAYRRIIYFLFIFLLFLFYQKKGFGNNALKFRTLGKKWQ